MKLKVMMAVCAAAMGLACAAADIFRPGEFFIGCNYWGSKAGVHMWRAQDWDEKEIERDFEALEKSGVEVMRVFPTWSEFQPLVCNLSCAGKRCEYLVEGVETPVYDPYYLDEAAMNRFRFFCDTAQKHNVKLMVAVLTGWMSGRLFIPRALEGLNLLTDPEALMLESRFVRAFVRRMKDHPAIVAWDLGNECNNLGKIGRKEELWVWLNTISSAIRLENPGQPVISGMHGMSSDFAAGWNLQHQGELLDVLTPHTYPSPYRPEANRGPLNTFRGALHQPAQSLFYQGVTGRRAFPQEVGNFGPTMSPPWMAARAIRQQAFATWMHGLAGYLWWVAFDQMHLDYPPFENNAMERELGIHGSGPDRAPSPQAKAIRAFHDFKASLPFKALPPRTTDAVCLLSERENFWQISFGAFMLVKQAGFDVTFCGAESQPLPEAKLYIVPSGVDWETYSHRAWKRVLARVKDGATMIVSRGGQAGYSDWTGVTGLETVLWICNHPIDFEYAGSKLHATDTYMAKMTPLDCTVLTKDQTGNPVFTERAYGKGKVLVVNFNLEQQVATQLAAAADGDFSNALWKLYAYAAKTAGIVRRVTREDIGLVLTEHPREDGSLLVCALNTYGERKSFRLGLSGKVGTVWNGQIDGNELTLEGNDGCIFVLK